MCKMKSCRSNVMAVMHGFTLSVLVSPLKTQKPPPLISTAWTAVLDLKILCNHRDVSDN